MIYTALSRTTACVYVKVDLAAVERKYHLEKKNFTVMKLNKMN